MLNERDLCTCLLLSLLERKPEINMGRMRLHKTLESLLDSHAEQVKRVSRSRPFGHTLFGTFADLDEAERELIHGGVLSWTVWPARYICEIDGVDARALRAQIAESLSDELLRVLEELCQEFVSREACQP